MRRFLMVAVALLSVGVAQGQVLWIGAGSGTSWEYQSKVANSPTWTHGSDPTPTGWLAFPLSEGTLLRLRVAGMPYNLHLLTGSLHSTLRAYTMGIDYTFPDPIGDATLSAGFGSYELRPKGTLFDAFEERKFGWYLGAGEWFRLSRRFRATAEITMHHAEVLETPTIVTVTAGLALSF